MMNREPCSACPWRIGIDAWAIGRDHTLEVPPLQRELMESIAKRQTQGFGAPVMACHLTHAGEAAIPPQERTCVGFALQVGAENLNYRMLVIGGKVDPARFTCSDPLHRDFAAMLAANPERRLAESPEKSPGVWVGQVLTQRRVAAIAGVRRELRAELCRQVGVA